jgi:LPXTG-motif cell wall-anchored protein
LLESGSELGFDFGTDLALRRDLGGLHSHTDLGTLGYLGLLCCLVGNGVGCITREVACVGEILQGPDAPAAVAKNLPIESVMSADIDGTRVTVAMAGTYVGVTGRPYAGTNAALWGVTYINSTSSGSTTPIPAATATKLASTGAEVEWLAIGSLIAVVAGAGFFALGRRKRA